MNLFNNKNITKGCYALLMLMMFGTQISLAQTCVAPNQCMETTGFLDAPASHTCTSGSAVAIFTESFDSGFGVFTEDSPPGPGTAGANDLTVSTLGDTPSAGTGPETTPGCNGGANDGEFIFLEGSSTLINETHCMTADIPIPALAGTLSGPLTGSFWYHMFGDNIGTLDVNLNGTNVFSQTGQQQTANCQPWLQGSFDLTALAGTTATIQVCMSEGNGAVSTFESDISIDHFEIFGCAVVCELTCGPDINISNDPGQCGAMASPTATTMNCSNPITNDFTGTADATSMYPVGTTVVTFSTTDDFGNPLSCSVNVTVTDTEGPTFNGCDDITDQLADGECCTFLTDAVTVTDNCGGAGGMLMTLSTTFIDNNGAAGNMFDVTNLGAFPVEIISYEGNLSGTSDVSVYFTTTASTYVGNETNAAEWTLVGTAAGVTAGAPTAFDVGATFMIQPGQTKGVFVVDNNSNIDYTNGANTYTDGILEINTGIGRGVNANPFAGGQFSPRTWNGTLIYQELRDIEITQTDNTGFAPDDCFPEGVYNLELSATGPEGITATCEQTITIEEYPEDLRVTSLTCNSLVNVSVDSACGIFIAADMFLEGNRYGCFDSLEVYLIPFGNTADRTGNVNNVAVDFSSLLNLGGTPHEYEVVDPSTGNSCWGYFIAEDKIPPVVDCPCTGAVPVFSFSGSIEGTDPQFQRPNGFNQGGNCTSFAPADHFYDAVDFTVSAAGSYTFNGNPSNGDTYGAIYDGPIDVSDGCVNAIAANDDTGGGADPLITVNLVPGVTYTYVTSTFSGGAQTGAWTVNITSNDGNVLGSDPQCEYLCYEIDAILNSTDLTANPDVANGDNCGPVTGSFSDLLIEDACGTSQIIRSWTFADASGNATSCQQVFSFNNISVADIMLPPALVEIGCGVGTSPSEVAAFFDVDSRRTPILGDDDYAETPNVLELNEGIKFAYPFYQVIGFDGMLHDQPIDNNICKLFASYTDTEIDACGAGCHGNSKVIRDWSILDWCSGETTPYTQLIKAVDNTPPTFTVDDATVSTRPWDCTAEFELPTVWELHDACDIAPTWFVSGPPGVAITGNATDGYVASGAPKGVHTFTYTASDCCGNTSSVDITVTVRDNVAPVASTKQDIVVALTPAGPGFESSAKIFTEHVNNYSYDACTDVFVEIRRTADAPDCGNLGEVTNPTTGDRYNNNITFNNQVPILHSEDNRNDTDGGQFVKFCCEDVNSSSADVDGDGVLDTGYHEVVMRVWDDANMTGVYGDVDQTGHADNYNEIWAYVKVEDNLPPIITCPADATISCYWSIDLSTDYGAGFQDASQADFDKTGSAVAYSTCQVEDIEFSDRLNLDDCGVGTIRRTWRASKEGKNGAQSSQCIQNITVEAAESVFNVTPPNGQPFNVGECEFNVDDIAANQKPSVEGGICDVIGESVDVQEFLFEDGVCKKWVVTYNYYNWCTGEDAGPIEVHYVYEDTEAPTIECEDACYSVDANCEYTLSLSKSAVDTSGCTTEGWLKWHVTVDTWADGVYDYVISSYAINPANGRKITQWATNDDLAIRFGLPLTVQWIHVDPTASGQDFASTAIPEDLGGKYSKHKVTYKVTDGCHNFASCSEEIEIADKKAPTPYCVSLSTALMADPDGDGPAEPMVELWACDFNVGSFDNCSPQEDLMYTFDNIPFVVDSLVRVGQIFIPVNATVPHYFNENGFVDWNGNGGLYPTVKAATIAAYNRGEIQKWIPETLCAGKVFTCDDAPQADVVMSVWDKQLNVDFCNVFLTFGGEVGDCSNTSTRQIDGTVSTATGNGVEGVEVQLQGLTEAQLTNTDGQGGYAFGFVNTVEDVAVTAARDGDDDNGVSTLDLVLIQRHILNINRFDSPYKVIAADINDSETITGADVVELRKLILGVTSEFANNTSWRFVDATQSMVEGGEFPFREERVSTASTNDDTAIDFVAVKIGDVNGSVETVENRSAKTVNLTFDNGVVAPGETVEIAISSADYVNAYGYQFTLDLNGLELVDVVAGGLDMTAQNVAVLNNNTVTVSYGSTVAETASDLFTLVVKANNAGKLSDMIHATSGVTRAEAYVGENMEIVQVALSSRGAAEYDLFQNEPNPFKDQTVIGFNMAEAGVATITVFDVAGRTLSRVTGEYNKGANTLALNRTDLGGVSGVLYYQLEAADYTAIKKMILID